ncbi:BnaC05g29630D [Brassica napus]|uniref:BnaC05g29630D protein n=1 Tax=Brassica napus TaxID=3708 RepID=A0A078FA84_BRANA|nr:BnaC05g29630D [Brassica napus]
MGTRRSPPKTSSDSLKDNQNRRGVQCCYLHDQPRGGINVHIRSKEASRWSCSCSRNHDQAQFQESQRRATSLESL